MSSQNIVERFLPVYEEAKVVEEEIALLIQSLKSGKDWSSLIDRTSLVRQLSVVDRFSAALEELRKFETDDEDIIEFRAACEAMNIILKVAVEALLRYSE